MKKKLLALAVSSLALTACSTTTVVKDISGPQVVDVMYAKFAQEVTTALNRLADVEDMNRVNVINAHNANTQPINDSYTGTVVKQNKIIVPDTYPQTQWRNDGVRGTAEDAKQLLKSQLDDDHPAPKSEAAVKAVNATSIALPTPTVYNPAKNSGASIVGNEIKRNESRIKANVSYPPAKTNCPVGSELLQKGRATICITTGSASTK